MLENVIQCLFLAHSLRHIPWVAEAFSRAQRKETVRFASLRHEFFARVSNTDMTDTGNRARKTSGTQGMRHSAMNEYRGHQM